MNIHKYEYTNPTKKNRKPVQFVQLHQTNWIMNSRVKVTFFDASCLVKIKSTYLHQKKCESIDIPKNAAGANYCFHSKYKGCIKCEDFDEESASEGSDNDEEDFKQLNAGVKIAFFDTNQKKCPFFDTLYNLTYSTHLKRDKCVFLGVPENAISLHLCLSDTCSDGFNEDS